MQIVSTLPALWKTPTVPLFSVLPVMFPMYPAKESPWWFLCWIPGTDYRHRLWVSWGSSLKSWEEGLNTTTTTVSTLPHLSLVFKEISISFSSYETLQKDIIKLLKIIGMHIPWNDNFLKHCSSLSEFQESVDECSLRYNVKIVNEQPASASPYIFVRWDLN